MTQIEPKKVENNGTTPKPKNEKINNVLPAGVSQETNTEKD